MIRAQPISSAFPSPGSPPGMSTSKSSKSSSFQSLNSDEGSVLSDANHFEDIGLDDENVHSRLSIRPGPNPLIASTGRNLAGGKRGPKPPRSFQNLHDNVYSANPRSTNVAGLTDPRLLSLTRGYSTTSLPSLSRNRSVSPGLSLTVRDINVPTKPRPRRGSWQSTAGRRKSLQELEHECDEDDGDDIPDGIVLDNVPISPRPAHERSPSRTPSMSPRSDGTSKERVRSLGNGTPPVARAQGSLRSPSWKSDGGDQPSSTSLKMRANGWNLALADLNADAKALTEKLEEHADEFDIHSRRPLGAVRPNTWTSTRVTQNKMYEKKERVKSSTPELPPLRKTNITVDPLPVSKEKEAVLSRTRPSWLPPKDPAEERRHLREYQKMMIASAKADERREAARRTRATCKDTTVDHLMHVWENTIIPRWNDAIIERRTRDMWWRGVASKCRGVVWARAIGNELGLTRDTYSTALSRARDLQNRVRTDRADAEDARRGKWFEQIRRDASDKTWKDMRIFQSAGPLNEALIDVLSAYAMYRNDIGYVAGCDTIAAMLLLNLNSSETTFIALANMLNRPLPLSFYTSDETAQMSVYNLVMQTLLHKAPPLYDHLTKTLEDARPEMYLNGLFLSMFTSHLTIEETARLWDVYVFEGDAVLVRAAVAFLLSREMALLGSKTAGDVMEVMSRANPRTGSHASSEAGAGDSFMDAVREAGKT